MSKHICINFVGQPKNLDILLEIYNNFIYSPDYIYHILYTTWVTEDISKFTEIFPNAYIKQIEKPNKEGSQYYDEYTHICNNYKYDETNARHGKLISNYFIGQYIRDQSRHTITEYEANKNIIFDIIVTTRPDVKIERANISTFFETIMQNTAQTLYVANDAKFDIYGRGSYPDALIMGQREHMLYLLDYISILKFCSLEGNQFHPETTSYKITEYKNISLIYLDLYVFIHY